MVLDLAAWFATRAWDSYFVCIATQFLLLVLTVGGLGGKAARGSSLGSFLWELFQVGLQAALFNALIFEVSPYWSIGLVLLTAGKAAVHRTAGLLVGVIAILVHATVGWESVFTGLRG